MTQWNLSGTYFETCNCEVACPCIFAGPPSHGECTALVAWHIDQGRFGDLALSGLNVAMAVHAPGHMLQDPWKVVAYFDDKASAAQAEALHAIFGGKAGGHPAMLASFVGELVAARSVPIHYRQDGKQAALSIPGVTEAEIDAIEGQGGAPVTISNHPVCIAPGVPAVTARSKHFQLQDAGFDWKLSGRNGFMSDFHYQSE